MTAKAKVTTETPTPLLEREELDHARVSFSGLPKEPLVLSVTYEDRFDTVTYELDASPDGTLEFTFPKIGAGGVARLGRRVTKDGDTSVELVGKPVALDSE